MIEFRVDGEIIAKERPRFNKQFGGVYTPQRTKNYENLIARHYKKNGFNKIDGYVKMNVKMFLKIPSKFRKKEDKQMCLDGVFRPDGRKDIDNILKSIMDGLNGFAYEDDKQVQEIHAEKWYADKDYVIIQLDEL